MRRAGACAGGLLAIAGLCAATAPIAAAAPPRVTGVTITSTATAPDTTNYAAGEPIVVEVRFDQDLPTVTGSPQLALTIGNQTHQADYDSAEVLLVGRPDNLIFKYRVQSSDFDSDGISIAGDALTRNGATIQNAAGEDAVLDLGSHAISNTASHRVRDDSVSFGSATGTALRYEANRQIVPFSLPAATGGDGTLTYRLEATPALPSGLSYTKPAGTATGGVIAGKPTEATPKRTYTLTARDTDGSTGTFTFTLHVGDSPVVSRVEISTSQESGETLLPGTIIEVSVEFSSDIKVQGETDLAIVIGSNTRRAKRHSFNAGGIRYRYEVRSTDFDRDGISIPADAHRLTEGSIQGALTQSADITIGSLAIVNDSNYRVGPTLSIDAPRVTEGDSGSADLTFTVTLNAVSEREVAVDYADAGTGTATSGTDYTALPSGTLTFAAGVTSQAVTVSVTGDRQDEPNETVIVRLSGATNAFIGTASGTGTIMDDITDDEQPALAISSPSVGEGDSGAADLTFTVTLNAAGGRPVTVNYADAGTGTATSGTDYSALTAGRLTFAVGVTSQAVTVSVTGDTTDEEDETVIVRLSGARNAGIRTANGTGTITDDDGQPALAISSPSVGEGDSGAASLTFTVTLNAASSKPVTVNYADAGTGTATSGTDYMALTAGSLTFAAGTTSRAVTVSVTGDTQDEEDETVIVTLSGATNATLGTADGTGTITDDDGQPALAIDAPSVGEGDSGAAALTFTVTLNAVSSKPVTVGYADAGTGTATSGTDYTALPTGSLTFAAGTTSHAVTVSVTGDTTDEEDETVIVTLSGATNATIGTANGTGTITDDDGQPALAIDAPSVAEGDSGAVDLTFRVTLNAVSGRPVTVTYADAGTGTATSGTDYTVLTAGSLTFAAGVTSQAVTVSVTGDTTDEEDETVIVRLSGATNAGIGTANGTGTITDDDGQPALAIDAPSVGEGDSGAADLTFTVSLNVVSGKPVTVTYADAGTGTATSGTDYTALITGTLTFAAGTTSQAVTVSVTGDTTDEEDETVVVTLSGATNATLGTASGMGTITDDDGQPALAISSPSVGEGDSGAASLTFTVSLNAVSGKPVTVDYADAGTGTATSGTDYTALTAGTLTFAAGTTSQAVAVSVTDDTTDEEDETVIVRLSGATNATLGTANGTGTITDDDGQPALAIDAPSVGEGDSGSTSLTFTVTLNAVSGKPVTVTYADAGTGTATSGTDYTALPTGSLTFAAGTTSQAVTVSVTGDTTDEEDETVIVRLSGATNATIGTASGTGTITDDDRQQASAIEQPALAISSPSVAEGDSGSADLTFTVTLSAVSGQPVTVTYADAGTGTATSGTDYTALTVGSLTFAAGTTSQAVTVSVTGDTIDEEDETVIVRLSGATNAFIGTTSGTGTITDDDRQPALAIRQPALAISSPSVGEGDSGAADLTFTVTLSAVSGRPVTVTYADAGTGTATSGMDYTALTAGTLTFAAGTTSQAVTVSVTGDTIEEANETVIVRLSGATNAFIGTASGTGTITDDDGASASTIDTPPIITDPGNQMCVKEETSLNFPIIVMDAESVPVVVVTDLPAGLSYDAASARVSGTVTADVEAGTYAVTITADDGVNAPVTLTFTIMVTAPVVDLMPTFGQQTISDRSWRQHQPIPGFTLPAAAGGDAPLRYELRPALPAGMMWDAETRHVSGTPTVAAEPTAYTWTGTDTDGDTATLTFSVTVVADRHPTFAATVPAQRYWTGLPISPLTLPAATGGDAPLTYRLTPPAGLTFDAQTRTLTGTPAVVVEEADWTLRATDADGDTAELTFRLAVRAQVVVTLGDAAAEEGAVLTFPVRLSAAAPTNVSLTWTTTSGTAQPGEDYRASAAGRQFIPAGTRRATLQVRTVDDTVNEPTETFLVRLAAAGLPVGVRLGEVEATGTIRDDDLARERRRALGPVLAGVGRTIATDTVDVIGQRFSGTVPTGRTTLGGQVLTLDRRRGDWRGAGRLAYGVARALGVEVVPPLAGDTGRMGVAGGWGLLTRPVNEGRPAAGWEMGDREAGARNPGVGFDAFGDGPLFEPGGSWDGLGQRGFDRVHAGRAQVGGWGLRRPLRFRRVSGGEMLSGSEFALPFRSLPGIEHAPPAHRETLHAEDPLPGERGLPAAAGAFPGTAAWTLWGRGTASGFDGKPKDGFSMNGRVFSGYVGLDYRWQSEALLGVAVAHSRGEVDYETAAVTEGDVTLRLTSVLPYAHWTPRPGLGVWGLLGAGWGKAAVEDEYGRVKTDLEMLMAAVGARQEVLTWRRIDVAVKADAFLTELETDAADGLPKTAGDAQRARLMLEGRTVRALSAGSEVVPRLEVGGRWDAGKAETGFGAELGGGLEYRHRPLGLGIEARGRYLLAHQRAAFDEWGASLTLTLDPGRAKRGLWLTLAPVWGAEASEVERMWGSAEGLRAGADRAAAGGLAPDRWELDLGYGRATHEGAGVLTTYGGLAVTGPGRHGYRLGGWLAVGESVDVSVEGEREERAGGAAHAVTVAGHLRW